MSDPHIVGRGIDTLKLNVKLADTEGHPLREQVLADNLLTRLHIWQEEAQQKMTPIPTTLPFHEARLIMYPNAAPSWKYILRNDCIELKIVPRLKLPMVAKVTLTSAYLWSVGQVQDALDEVEGLLCDLFGPHLFLQAAQLDLCADLVGLVLPTEWEEVFVTHAIGKRQIGPSHKDNAYYHGRTLETLLFSGHGRPVSCKLYDKTAEIKQNTAQDKRWFYPLWLEQHWNGVETVYRVEYAIEREGLNEMNLHSITETLRNIPRIWAYCTQEWLRMVVPAPTRNRNRWKTHPTWGLIQQAFKTYQGETVEGIGPLVRERRRERNFEQGVAALAGYITTLGAWYELEFQKSPSMDDLFALVRQEVLDRWLDQRIDPVEQIRLKKFLYAQKP